MSSSFDSNGSASLPEGLVFLDEPAVNGFRFAYCPDDLADANGQIPARLIVECASDRVLAVAGSGWFAKHDEETHRPGYEEMRERSRFADVMEAAAQQSLLLSDQGFTTYPVGDGLYFLGPKVEPVDPVVLCATAFDRMSGSMKDVQYYKKELLKDEGVPIAPFLGLSSSMRIVRQRLTDFILLAQGQLLSGTEQDQVVIDTVQSSDLFKDMWSDFGYPGLWKEYLRRSGIRDAQQLVSLPGGLARAA